jgi:hypothetical protein
VSLIALGLDGLGGLTQNGRGLLSKNLIGLSGIQLHDASSPPIPDTFAPGNASLLEVAVPLRSKSLVGENRRPDLLAQAYFHVLLRLRKVFE